jgi:hypothetical protein
VIFFSSRRTCSANDCRKNKVQGCQLGALDRIAPCVISGVIWSDSYRNIQPIIRPFTPN